MILVTGATGHLGSATIAHLLKHTPASNIAAFVRDEAKAENLKAQGVSIRVGTFDDAASVAAAMQGIEKVLLISTIDEHRFQQHQTVINAAVKAGVKHLAYTGVTIRDVETSAIGFLMTSHFQTDEYLKQSGLTYTLLRNMLYADVVPMYVGAQVFEQGINLPAGDGKVSYALRREMGEAAANVLLQEGHENKTYEITGSEAHSFADVAAALSELKGQPVAYHNIPADGFADQLKAAGLPDFVAGMIAAFMTDIKAGRFDVVSNDLETLLGRKPAGLQAALKEVYGL